MYVAEGKIADQILGFYGDWKTWACFRRRLTMFIKATETGIHLWSATSLYVIWRLWMVIDALFVLIQPRLLNTVFLKTVFPYNTIDLYKIAFVRLVEAFH